MGGQVVHVIAGFLCGELSEEPATSQIVQNLVVLDNLTVFRIVASNC
jgi:hypothetical protein